METSENQDQPTRTRWKFAKRGFLLFFCSSFGSSRASLVGLESFRRPECKKSAVDRRPIGKTKSNRTGASSTVDLSLFFCCRPNISFSHSLPHSSNFRGFFFWFSSEFYGTRLFVCFSWFDWIIMGFNGVSLLNRGNPEWVFGAREMKNRLECSDVCVGPVAHSNSRTSWSLNHVQVKTRYNPVKSPVIICPKAPFPRRITIRTARPTQGKNLGKAQKERKQDSFRNHFDR